MATVHLSDSTGSPKVDAVLAALSTHLAPLFRTPGGPTRIELPISPILVSFMLGMAVGDTREGAEIMDALLDPNHSLAVYPTSTEALANLRESAEKLIAHYLEFLASEKDR